MIYMIYNIWSSEFGSNRLQYHLREEKSCSEEEENV